MKTKKIRKKSTIWENSKNSIQKNDINFCKELGLCRIFVPTIPCDLVTTLQ